ncbi:hypothetical protein HK101_006807, partial [Irineochytrium annulatum]
TAAVPIGSARVTTTTLRTRSPSPARVIERERSGSRGREKPRRAVGFSGLHGEEDTPEIVNIGTSILKGLNASHLEEEDRGDGGGGAGGVDTGIEATNRVDVRDPRDDGRPQHDYEGGPSYTTPLEVQSLPELSSTVEKIARHVDILTQTMSILEQRVTNTEKTTSRYFEDIMSRMEKLEALLTSGSGPPQATYSTATSQPPPRTSDHAYSSLDPNLGQNLGQNPGPSATLQPSSLPPPPETHRGLLSPFQGFSFPAGAYRGHLDGEDDSSGRAGAGAFKDTTARPFGGFGPEAWRRQQQQQQQENGEPAGLEAHIRSGQQARQPEFVAKSRETQRPWGYRATGEILVESSGTSPSLEGYPELEPRRIWRKEESGEAGDPS